jgi:hypothetical protein
MSLDTKGKSDSDTHVEMDVSYNTANKGHNLDSKASYQADAKSDDGADLNTNNRSVIS